MIHRARWRTVVALGLSTALALLFGLAIARWLAENLYLVTPLFFYRVPSAVIATLAAGSVFLVGLLALERYARRSSLLVVAVGYLPFSLLAIYVLPREINTVRGSVLVVGALGLATALGLSRVLPSPWRERGAPVCAFVIPLAAYLITLAPTVGQHDTFEFQVLSYQLGIAHPTGYPLYIMIGKLFTLLPFGNVAFRVNLSSAVFAAGAVVLLYATIQLITRDRWASLLAALAFGFGYAVWSQAVEAEVYALNALFVCATCYLLIRASLETDASSLAPAAKTEGGRDRRWRSYSRSLGNQQVMIILAAFVYGLGLTHHRTLLLLAPAILLYAALNRAWQMFTAKRLLAVTVAFLSPLFVVHLYIPVRWWQIHGQVMHWQQFADLVAGRQFAAALRWSALLRDPQRTIIMGRTLLQQYPLPALVLAAGGAVYLVCKRSEDRGSGAWPEGAFFLLSFGAYALFGFSYHVPDVSLFLIPSFAFAAVGLGVAASQIRSAMQELMRRYRADTASPMAADFAKALVVTAVAVIPLKLIWVNLPTVDKSDAYSWHDWGVRVLEQDLPPGSVILADSEKMAPLHYLQRVEGIRPDTETAVFADEESNRAEIRRHLENGTPVYLARFLPGLESSYYLRSFGPLVEISLEPLPALPTQAQAVNLALADRVTLLGYEIDSRPVDRAGKVCLTLFWKAEGRRRKDYEVRLRLVGSKGQARIETKGRVPVNGLYPTGAWRPGEIVPDYHEVEVSGLTPPGTYTLQVGLFAPLAQTDGSTSKGDSGYVPLQEIDLGTSRVEAAAIVHPLRANFGDRIVLLGHNFPTSLSPGVELPLTLHWQPLGDTAEKYHVTLSLFDQNGQMVWHSAEPSLLEEHPSPNWRRGDIMVDTHRVAVPKNTVGPMRLYLALEEADSHESVSVINGWLASPTSQLPLLEVNVKEPPTATADASYLPANFENRILLVDYEIHNPQVQRGGALHISLTWQAISSTDEDYTVFVHILDDSDRLWGQEDIQPAYGTYPTSQWREGELIVDPHTVWTIPDAPLGLYRIQVGIYLLRNMERLNLLDDAGQPVGNRLTVDLMEMVP